MNILEIEIIRRECNDVYFRIIKQDTRILKRDDFEECMSNGIRICSINSPEARRKEDTFFIRGDMKHRDLDECVCSETFFCEIVDAIKELNEKYLYEEVYD